MSKILRSWLVLLLGIIAIGALAAACGDDDDDDDSGATATNTATGESDGDSASGSDEEVVVGFLYVGTIDDGGYNQAAYQGEVAVSEMPGVKTIHAENVPETAEAERVMEQMIAQGATIIFPTSFGHLDPALNVAAKHPDVTFFHEGGLESSENLGTFFGTIWQTEYLAGMAAGSATESNKLGFVVAFPISQTLLNINAFHLGAKSVNPDVTTTVVFTGNWCDPAKNAEATESLASQGIDVITQHQDCPVPVIEAAERAGILSVGYHVDDAQFAPDGWLTAAIWDWTDLFTDLVQQAIDGSYEPSVQRYYLSDGVVDLAPFGDKVPADVRTLIDEKRAEMEGDTPFLPFIGPVADQDGDVRIADGETPTIEFLESIDWLAEDVVGTIPN